MLGTTEMESSSLSRTGGYCALLAATTRDSTAVLLQRDSRKVFVETGSAEIGDVSLEGNLGPPGSTKKGHSFTPRSGRNVVVQFRPSRRTKTRTEPERGSAVR